MSDDLATRDAYFPEAPFPPFEGHKVDGIAVTTTASKSAFDEVDTIMSIDDQVQVMGRYRCVGVSHTIDEKTGTLIRVQTLKPERMDLMPFDPSDPDDDGVLRRNVPGER